MKNHKSLITFSTFGPCRFSKGCIPSGSRVLPLSDWFGSQITFFSRPYRVARPGGVVRWWSVSGAKWKKTGAVQTPILKFWHPEKAVFAPQITLRNMLSCVKYWRDASRITFEERYFFKNILSVQIFFVFLHQFSKTQFSFLFNPKTNN